MAKWPEPFTHTPTLTVHDGMKIEVVHTNDLEVVAKNLDMYEKMLEGRQPVERFMGLDLKYTSPSFNCAWIRKCWYTSTLGM